MPEPPCPPLDEAQGVSTPFFPSAKAPQGSAPPDADAEPFPPDADTKLSPSEAEAEAAPCPLPCGGPLSASCSSVR